MDVKKIFVDCRRDGRSLRIYEFGWPIAVVPGPSPERNKLIDEAKNNLTTDRIAFPPYAGITFDVRYP